MNQNDRFSTSAAILLAIVALLGALIAWRAAVVATAAGDADFAGLNANLNAEQTHVLNQAIMTEHYRRYTAYLRHNELGNLIAADLASTPVDRVEQLDQAAIRSWEIAATHQDFFPNRYLDPTEGYDTARELGEAWAEAGQQKDIEPAPHFTEADQLRAKSTWLVGTLTILGVSLVFFTLAEGLKSNLMMLRYGAVALGLIFMLLGGGAALVIGLFG